MSTKEKDIQIIVAGAAGQGSKKAGNMIGKILNSYGYRVFVHEDYESVIQGGHNFSQVCASEEEMNAIREKADFLLALNDEAVEKHKHRLKEGGTLIHDSGINEELLWSEEINILEAPLDEIIKEAGGIDLMKNTALVSFFLKAAGMDLEEMDPVLRKELPVKTEENMEVARVAFEKGEERVRIEKGGNDPLPLLPGNAATALGAIDAGLENYFAYPMTPSTGILNFLSGTEGVRSVQPENEIAVASMALGASYAGKRTMTGTSGGGFALMTESVSFSAQAEVPFCVALSQRMGPATGVPTYEAQADLLFALNAGHGDMMRFVVAPGDADEAYYLSGKALNVAWKYRLPSIILLDKEVSENTYGLKREYEVTKEEAQEGPAKVSGYEHDEKGVATEDMGAIKEGHERRLRKYEELRKEVNEMDPVKVSGEGEVAVVFWGSSKGAVLKATEEEEVKLVQPLILQPFPEGRMKDALKGVKKVICVELNATGQLSQILRYYGIETHEKVLKYDGRPFTVEELREKLRELLSATN